MRRLLAFVVLLACSLPVGLSITGCGHNPNNYCIKNGHAYGITTSQVVYVELGPEVTGLSLAWGQTGTLSAPQAFNCNGDSASVTKYTYASSNLLLADISPSGTLCAGTWNRNSPGGVPDFSICTPPSGASLSSFKGCSAATCGTVQITATGGAVTSNPVNVYIHPPITSITIPNQQACMSQGQTLSTSLLAETTVTGPGGTTLCSPTTTSCTSPSANVGVITYNPVTTSVVTINNTTNPATTNPVTGTGSSSTPNPNGIATANLPGSTVINAATSEVTSAAGFFSTCPPVRIALNINGLPSATVTTSSPQTVVSTVTDTNGAIINGLPLIYSSTEPQNLSVGSTGLVTATFPSHATVTALCQPPSCNPAPVNLVGNLGNGMPVAGNRVSVNSPGRSSNVIWFASSQAPYFSDIDLSTGRPASPIRLPYTPNSMVMDQAGDTLFFGSYHELMTYSTLANSLSKEVTSVPGVVLAVSPTGSTAVINDQLRQVIYLYSVTASTFTSIGGVGFRAQYSPDGTTVYVTGVDPATGQNTLFVNSNSTGWSSYPLTNEPTNSCPLEAAGTTAAPAYNPAWDPFCGPALTITVPSVAAVLAGNTTAARSFCPNASAEPPYYPPAGDVGVTTTQLTATADGFHILGADNTTFTDILLGSTSGPAPGVPTGACPAYTGPPLTLTTNPISATLPVAATEIDQVVSSPDSSVAFVTYNASGATGLLPFYQPLNTGALGTLGTVQLSAGAQAPVAGVFSPDGSIFFTSTSGDNLVHMVNTSSLTDTQTIDPKLLNGSGAPVPAQFLAVKSRPTT
jgi:trimeric autotransporter adhesin